MGESVFFSLYSLGVQPLICLNTRLKVDMLGNPECRATSVMERSGCVRSSSATLILKRVTYAQKV